MPTSSKKQHNFMAAVAKNPAFAKKAGVPQSVGQEFLNADKSRKFKEGGDMKAKKELPAFMMKKGEAKKPAKYAKGGVTRADGVASKGHTKGKMVAMKMGGKTCK